MSKGQFPGSSNFHFYTCTDSSDPFLLDSIQVYVISSIHTLIVTKIKVKIKKWIVWFQEVWSFNLALINYRDSPMILVFHFHPSAQVSISEWHFLCLCKWFSHLYIFFFSLVLKFNFEWAESIFYDPTTLTVVWWQGHPPLTRSIRVFSLLKTKALVVHLNQLNKFL